MPCKICHELVLIQYYDSECEEIDNIVSDIVHYN